MLYGSHVFARAKLIPDQAIARGEETFKAALLMGDRSLEFLAAGGTAMAHLDVGDVPQARTWLERAATAAAAMPTPLRARQLELWRGLTASAAGDVAQMREHLERAIRFATEQGRPAARCELLARLASESVRLGTERDDQELLELAERSALEAKAILSALPGRPPWGAQADAVLAASAMVRGDAEAALAAARSAVEELRGADHEDVYPQIILPVAAVILAAGEEAERQFVGGYLRLILGLVAQRTLDEDVRVRWFRGPIGSELVRLAGPVGERVVEDGEGLLGDDDRLLLALLTEGLTNREIAERLDVTEDAVGLRLQAMFAHIGASSRGEATAFALREGVL
jgi:ATP/maltotriose-dependent transcriptional regulator MalT